ncbi:MAG: flagellar hook-associated protein 3 [Termitinemataceae bacterium]|nr:MAG: flagellar hook-associated protein 3 [Termitinemataceae bacterium]
MFRISTNMPNDDIQYRLRRKEDGISAIQSKIAQQTRLHELRDDPFAASHAVRYDSYLARLNRFEKNTLDAKEDFVFTDGYMQQANEIMQRVRELAVQGANGIYSKDETKMMGIEINELLKELVSIANATNKDGKQIFAGDKAFTKPFRIVDGSVDGIGEAAMIRIEYRGAGANRRQEITDNTYTNLDISGGDVFWAEKMQIAAATNSDNYQVPAETSIFVDGIEIGVNQGDNVLAIAEKINLSPAPVKAYLDPETRGIVIEGTDAHLIRLEDAAGSNVLQSLGLIRPVAEEGAPNFAVDARVSGGSIFDVVIGVRNALLNGDQLYVGGQGLGGIDQGMDNLRTRLADIGSRTERVQLAWQRLNMEIPNVTESLDREAGIDLASAALELGEMDMAHKAALQTAARILPNTFRLLALVLIFCVPNTVWFFCGSSV